MADVGEGFGVAAGTALPVAGRIGFDWRSCPPLDLVARVTVRSETTERVCMPSGVVAGTTNLMENRPRLSVRGVGIPLTLRSQTRLTRMFGGSPLPWATIERPGTGAPSVVS